MRSVKLVGCYLALVSAAALASPTLALANGRFPAAQHVLVGPGAASSTIVLRTTFGFAVSDDGGASFHWVCELAIGYAPMASYDPPFALDAMGRVHVGLTDPRQQTVLETDRCTFGRDPALDGQYLEDLDNTPDGRSLVAITSAGGSTAQNRVYRSDDQGTTWSPLGAGNPLLYLTVELSPSNTQRLYATASVDAGSGGATRAAFYRSDDGGATLREPSALPTAGLGEAYVAGVDPSNADTVFVRVPVSAAYADDAGLPETTTILLRTRDGGASFREVARSSDAMLGFAISDDGRTVWYGGQDGGLYRSDDGGDSFERIGDTHVTCLRQHAGALYVCANAALQPDHYSLYRSHDGGATLEPILALHDIDGAFACTSMPTSPEVTQCASMWPTQQSMLPPSPTRDAGAMDASADAGTTPTHAGCGCSAAGAPRGSLAGEALALVAAFALARRRRRA